MLSVDYEGEDEINCLDPKKAQIAYGKILEATHDADGGDVLYALVQVVTDIVACTCSRSGVDLDSFCEVVKSEIKKYSKIKIEKYSANFKIH